LIFFVPLADSWIVKTSYGFLKGMPINSIDGQACRIFKGIPIAKPPVGERRFKLPERPERWQGIRDATRYSAACMSNSSVSRSPQKIISEDCLYMNIFVSENCLRKKRSCPVVFFIHGGSLNYDSAVMFDDQYITDRYSSKDVVFVISAYRLGFFGVSEFVDDTVVPRNLALYDILTGLEMVHSEVEAFGGDPKRVTLMGHSQGASVAVVFAVSSIIDPVHRLFQQVLALSPTVNYRITSNRIDLTWRLAHEVGCTPSPSRPDITNSSQVAEMVTCLRKVDALDLLAKQRLFEDRDGLVFDGIVYGQPFVDEDVPNETFISQCQARPMISTSTGYEFDMVSNEDTDDIGTFLQFSHMKQVRSKFFYDMSFKEFRHKYLTQVIFTNNVIYSTVFTTKGYDTYLMELNLGPSSIHSSDMPYFIGVHRYELTEDEKLVDQFYAKSFINFIHGRKPHKDWLPFEPTKRNYFSLKVDIKKNIFPHNEMDYHSDIVDYWLYNMTQFDKNLPVTADPQLRFDEVDATSSHSILRSALSFTLFALSLAIAFFILMAACAALSPQDPPNHERVPLVIRKQSVINRKPTVIVSSLKRR
ncbi:hypothetical protein V3C99_013582, partial [Haemonchus contortus]